MTDAILKITNLKKTYSDGTKAVKGITFEVRDGEFFALLGPNGAGKSTTIGIVASLVNKTSGKVFVCGKDVDKERAETKKCIGLVPQEFNFGVFEKVIDIVVNQAGYYGIPRNKAIPRAEELLKQLGLWEKRNTQARQLSGGMKRKLMIVRALMHEPRVLILDEPTAGVDVETRREMWEYFQKLKKSGTTIILTTHYLEEAEQLCNRIVIINQGIIAENTNMKELLAKLDEETFVLDLKKPITTCPTLEGYSFSLPESSTLEVTATKKQDLNTVFALLKQRDITVLSMRNKTNRLEELFVEMTSNGKKNGKKNKHESQEKKGEQK